MRDAKYEQLFIQFLEKRGVKEKFESELKRINGETIQDLFKETWASIYITTSFPWCDSHCSNSYWSKLDSEWQKVIERNSIPVNNDNSNKIHLH